MWHITQRRVITYCNIADIYDMINCGVFLCKTYVYIWDEVMFSENLLVLKLSPYRLLCNYILAHLNRLQLNWEHRFSRT